MDAAWEAIHSVTLLFSTDVISAESVDICSTNRAIRLCSTLVKSMKKLIFGMVICGHLVYHKVSTFFCVLLLWWLHYTRDQVLFYVNTRINSIILFENQVFTPDLLVGKLSNKFFKILIDRKMKKKDICELTGIGTSTMAKMAKDENVSLDVLARIYRALNCTMDDILDIIPAENEQYFGKLL